MKRRIITRALAMAMSLMMLSGETIPAYAEGTTKNVWAEGSAAEEETEDDNNDIVADKDTAEETQVKEEAALSENSVKEEDPLADEEPSEDAAENEGSADEVAENEGCADEAADDVQASEDVQLAASPETDFEWNGNIISKYIGTAAEVVIPARTVQIGEEAFKDKTVTKVSFEKGENLSIIGPYAFAGCASLKDFVIPAAVSKIGGHAFEGCALTEVTLPSGVILDGDAAFKDCKSLTTVKNITDGLKIDYKDLFKHPTFEGCSALTTVEFAAGISRIPAELFNGCIALKSITIPETVGTIEAYAFYGCTVLTDVVFQSDKNLNEIGEYAFSTSISLKNFAIPSSVKKIGGHAFEDCSSLTEVTLPTDVIFNGDAAFKNCTSLKSVKNVSGGLKVDYKDLFKHPTFEGCSSLTDISFAAGISKIPAEIFDGCIALKAVTIPKSVTKIEEYAFYGCTSLTDVVFEDSPQITEIGDYAFATSISLSNFSIPSGIKSIGGHAFEGCSSLREITLPKNVLFNGDGSFKDCTSLTAVKNVTDGIVFKSKDLFTKPVFQGCTALTDIGFTNGMTAIPAELFAECVSLRSITIPNSVKTIGAKAFNGCSALRVIHLPSKLKSVKEAAFAECISITEVYYGGKSTSEKIKKASEKNNEPLFAVAWIKENRADDNKTGELTLDGAKVSSLKAALKLMNDKNKDYVISLDSDLKGEKNLSVPAKAKSVTINGNGHVIEINGTKLVSKVPLILNNVKFRALDKKGNAAKFTINAKTELTINGIIAFEAKSTTVKAGSKLMLNTQLAVQKLSCKEMHMGAAAVLAAVKGCSISIKNTLNAAEGAALTLEEGFKPVSLGGTAAGKLKISGIKLNDGSQIFKASIKKMPEDVVWSVFDVSEVKTSAIAAHLQYIGSKLCIFADAISVNGKTFGVWKSAVAEMNAAQKAAGQKDFVITLNADVNMMGKFLLPKKGYNSLAINGGGHVMTFSGDISLTGNTTISNAVLNKVDKKGNKQAGKVKKGRFSYNGPETF
ncbi:MAG: leucine-rich repeat protein [Lachnospiraceae bacterium]|nr:leucine-rich repeat protein [Lachnospiraceae bacterium]